MLASKELGRRLRRVKRVTRASQGLPHRATPLLPSSQHNTTIATWWTVASSPGGKDDCCYARRLTGLLAQHDRLSTVQIPTLVGSTALNGVALGAARLEEAGSLLGVSCRMA